MNLKMVTEKFLTKTFSACRAMSRMASSNFATTPRCTKGSWRCSKNLTSILKISSSSAVSRIKPSLRRTRDMLVKFDGSAKPTLRPLKIDLSSRLYLNARHFILCFLFIHRTAEEIKHWMLCGSAKVTQICSNQYSLSQLKGFEGVCTVGSRTNESLGSTTFDCILCMRDSWMTLS